MKGYYQISKESFYNYGGLSNRGLTRKANKNGSYGYYAEFGSNVPS